MEAQRLDADLDDGEFLTVGDAAGVTAAVLARQAFLFPSPQPFLSPLALSDCHFARSYYLARLRGMGLIGSRALARADPGLLLRCRPHMSEAELGRESSHLSQPAWVIPPSAADYDLVASASQVSLVLARLLRFGSGTGNEDVSDDISWFIEENVRSSWLEAHSGRMEQEPVQNVTMDIETDARRFCFWAEKTDSISPQIAEPFLNDARLLARWVHAVDTVVEPRHCLVGQVEVDDDVVRMDVFSSSLGNQLECRLRVEIALLDPMLSEPLLRWDACRTEDFLGTSMMALCAGGDEAYEMTDEKVFAAKIGALAAMKAASLLFPVASYQKHLRDFAFMRQHLRDQASLHGEAGPTSIARSEEEAFGLKSAPFGTLGDITAGDEWKMRRKRSFLAGHCSALFSTRLVDEKSRFLRRCSSSAVVGRRKNHDTSDARSKLLDFWEKFAPGFSRGVLEEVSPEKLRGYAIGFTDASEIDLTDLELDESPLRFTWRKSQFSELSRPAAVALLKSRIAATAFFLWESCNYASSPSECWHRALAAILQAAPPADAEVVAEPSRVFKSTGKEIMASQDLRKELMNALLSEGPMNRRRSHHHAALLLAESEEHRDWCSRLWLRLALLDDLDALYQPPPQFSVASLILRNLQSGSRSTVFPYSESGEERVFSPLMALPPPIFARIIDFCACDYRSLLALQATSHAIRISTFDPHLPCQATFSFIARNCPLQIDLGKDPSGEASDSSGDEESIEKDSVLLSCGDVLYGHPGVRNWLTSAPQAHWNAELWADHTPGLDWFAVLRDFVRGGPGVVLPRLNSDCVHCHRRHFALTRRQFWCLNHSRDDEGYMAEWCTCQACGRDTGSWEFCAQSIPHRAREDVVAKLQCDAWT